MFHLTGKVGIMLSLVRRDMAVDIYTQLVLKMVVQLQFKWKQTFQVCLQIVK